MKKVIKLVAFIVYIVFAMNFLVQGQVVTQPERRYHVIDLGILGDSGSSAVAINNKGEVVGYYGASGNVRSFLYSKGSIKDIGTFCCGSDNTVVLGLNDKSEIVGYGRHPFNGSITAFLYSGGSIQYVGKLEDLYSQAAGINNQGEIVGKFIPSGSQYTRSFLSQSGTIKDLGTFGGVTSEASAINNNGQIVGFAALNSREYHAFLYENGSMRDLGTLGGNFSTANALNSQGQVVGRSQLPNNGFMHAFLYSEGEIKDLGTLGGNHSNALGINDSGEVVGNAHPSGSTILRAFLYSNGSMKDLNDLLMVTNSGWVISFANAINNSGQIVGWGTSPFGQQRAVLLNPVPFAESIAAIKVQPSQPVYGNVLIKEEGKDSLVVVTHGRIPTGDDPAVSTEWVNSMTAAIVDYLNSSNINNWQVFGYMWIEGANIALIKGGPQTALRNAKQQGVKLGRQIVSQGYTNIHFIAHSAGAALIQSATDVIKTNNSSIVVHETFLDPYVGVIGSEAAVYGNRADWSDNYFTQDDGDTGFGNGLPFTQFIMPHTYNVDVTQLDVNKVKQDYFVTGNGAPCYQTKSKHDWPITFYQNTIIGTATLDYQGYGFPLSKIGGNYANATANYLVGNGRLGNPVPLKELGVPDLKCFLDIPVPTYPSSPLDLFNSPAAQSTTGTIDKYPNGSIKEISGSPAWLVTFVTVSNVANIVSFEADFQSANNTATGLLSVYWDGNNIGSIDEQAVQDGLQRYSFKFSTASSNSMHGLGFRLDPFGDIQSIVVVTNVTVTASGVTEPFSLARTGGTNGLQNYQLTGQAGFEYGVQATTNFVDWITIASLLNTNGTVQFYDKSSTNNVQRFYRVVAPN